MSRSIAVAKEQFKVIFRSRKGIDCYLCSAEVMIDNLEVSCMIFLKGDEKVYAQVGDHIL